MKKLRVFKHAITLRKFQYIKDERHRALQGRVSLPIKVLRRLSGCSLFDSRLNSLWLLYHSALQTSIYCL